MSVTEKKFKIHNDFPLINWKVEKLFLRKQKPVIINFTRQQFIKTHFPNATQKNWKNWQWQIKNSITDMNSLHRILVLSSSEWDELSAINFSLPLRITPYYASVISCGEKNHPLLKCVIPSAAELVCNAGESTDPLHEEEDEKVPGLVHRYPDRVLVLLTDFCSSNCRYCTRSRLVNQQKMPFNFEKVVEYITVHKEIRDVIISGGDPLTLSDAQLEYYLHRLRAINHVEIIRIGSKVPVVLPQRINSKLTTMLKKYHPLFINIHFTHPSEITDECKTACLKLVDAGIPLGSQTVLLKEVNDSIEVMKELFHKLLLIRVKPYYLYQCDPIIGSAHFRTSVKKGLEIIEGLRGHTSGLCVPTFVIDAPGGGGKIPLQPDYYQGEDEQNIYLRNFKNNIYSYPLNTK